MTIGKANSDYTGIKFPINAFQISKNNNAQAASGTKKITTVDMTPNKSINRADLDNLSPYASLGVTFTQKSQVGTPESYAQAAPELGRWHGNFTIDNQQEAVDYLSAYNTALKTYSQVAPHIQDKQSPYAELFNPA